MKSECPPLIGVRPTADVAILLARAKKDGMGNSWAKILNKCAREVLTPKYGSKRVLNIQDEIERRRRELMGLL